MLATAGRDLRLWRLSDGKRLLAINTHEARVHELRFSPDGNILVCTRADTAGKESEIQLIDLAQLGLELVALGFDPFYMQAKPSAASMGAGE